MIILTLKNKINIFSKYSNISSVQRRYNTIVMGLDLDSISCPSCNSRGVRTHAFYYRYVSISSLRYRLRIMRIICPVCGKTHSILIEGMLPFTSFLYDALLFALSEKKQSESFSYRDYFYYARKFNSSDDLSYSFFCSIFSRNIPFLIFSTWLSYTLLLFSFIF